MNRKPSKVSNHFELCRKLIDEKFTGILECKEWPYWTEIFKDGDIVESSSAFINNDDDYYDYYDYS